MATANIYGFPDTKAHSPRNAFDMSYDILFNSPAGMLLPAYVEDVKAGDKLKLSCKNFTRTNAVHTAAYMSFTEKVDFLFVPYRLLWSAYNQWRLGTTQPRSSVALQDIARLQFHPVASWADLVYRFNPDDPGEPIHHAVFDKWPVDALGIPRFPFVIRMLDLLGYGLPPVENITSVVSPTDDQSRVLANHFGKIGENYFFNYFRLAAYQCIYQYFYRNEDFESLEPACYNADSLFISQHTYGNSRLHPDLTPQGVVSGYKENQSNPFSLYGFAPDKVGYSPENNNRLTLYRLFTPRYKNWRKDVFTTIKPLSGVNPEYSPVGDFNSTDFVVPPIEGDAFGDVPPVGGYRPTVGSYTIPQFRRALALDKFLRLGLYADKNYSSLYESIFGVKIDEPDVPRYLGTFSSDIKISEVVATAAGSDGTSDASTSVLGELAGKGIGTGQSHVFDAEFKEDGIVMGIHYIVPFLYYNPYRFNPFVMKMTKFDYYYPSFDGLGLSPVYVGERGYWTGSENYSSNYFSLLGFNTRYHEYKQRVNEVHGTFATGQSESHWTITANNSPVFNPSYGFKVLPTITDSIFGVNWNGAPSTDPFKCFYSFNVTKVSNMEAIGVPSV